MALNTFGWTDGSMTIARDTGRPMPRTKLLVWADEARTTPVTALYDRNGSALTGGVVSDTEGWFGFKASDVYAKLFVSMSATGKLYVLIAHEAVGTSGGSGGAVQSVAGKTGAVALGISDISGLSTALSGKGTSNVVIGTAATDAKAGNWKPTIADLPAGVMVFSDTTTRPTSRTDLRCIFTSPSDPGANRLGNDLWLPPSTTTADRGTLVVGTYKPTASTAGVLPSITRTAYTGNRTITVDGTVIENQDITGWIKVRAANVVIRNCKFVGFGSTPTGDSAFIDCNSPSCVNASIEDVTIDPATGHYYLFGINGWNFTAKRVHIRNCVDAFQPYNTAAPGGDLKVSILGCLGEEFYWSAVPSGVHSDLQTHNDFIQIQDGRGITAVGNVADMHYSARSTGTPPSNGVGTDGRPRPMGSLTAFMYTPNFATKYVGPCTITDNWVYGGSYPVNAGSTGGFDIGTFKRNKFDHNQGSQNSGGNGTRVILLAKDTTGTGGTAATVVDLGTGTEVNVYEDNLVAVPVQYA